MMSWCRSNGIPVINWYYYDDIGFDRTRYVGSKLFASDLWVGYDDSEELVFQFIIREQDYELWRLRFA